MVKSFFGTPPPQKKKKFFFGFCAFMFGLVFVLLSASFERLSVSCAQDFLNQLWNF